VLRALVVGLFFVCFVAAIATTGRTHDDSEQIAIRGLLVHTFEKPDAKLTVNPIAVEGPYAVADWTQGEMGGRALLRKDGHDWTLILCSGDALKALPVYRDAGIAEALAKRLLATLGRLEADMDQTRLAQLSRFDGVMKIEGDPHAHAHH
jgi:hypothetical protein